MSHPAGEIKYNYGVKALLYFTLKNKIENKNKFKAILLLFNINLISLGLASKFEQFNKTQFSHAWPRHDLK